MSTTSFKLDLCLSRTENDLFMKEIFNKFGLIKFIEINNKKETYLYGDYKIVIEDVDGKERIKYGKLEMYMRKKNIKID